MAFLRKRSGSADSAVVKGKKVEAHFTVSVFMTCMGEQTPFMGMRCWVGGLAFIENLAVWEI